MKKTIKGMQGDVQFKTIDVLPSSAKKIENKAIALGEHSGHMHIVTGPLVEMFEHEGKIYTVIGSDGASLQHIHESKLTPMTWKKKETLEKADHEPHFLPEGIYEFFIQNSYNPYAKIMEKVID